MKMTEVKKLTENKFPKKELLILAIGEALCVLLTILVFLGISITGIIDFDFSYRVITGALLGAVVVILNFVFLSVSVNKAVDEYIALRGDKEMTEEEAEQFASKNTVLIQNAVKKSFTLRVVSMGATLVVAFLLDWFNPIATIAPILAYQPILTWGNYICESAKKIITRVENEKAKASSETEPTVAEEAVSAEPVEKAAEDSAAEENDETSIPEPEGEETVASEPQEEESPNSDGEVEESTENSEPTEEETPGETEENKESTEGSGIDEL